MAAAPTLPPGISRKPADVVRELNREYALVLLGGGAAILREATDAYGRPEFRFLSIDGFKEWMRPYKLWRDDKPIPVATVWLNDERRRQYDGIVFAPAEAVPEHYYNLWKGFAVEPSLKGSCDKFIEHIAENVCRGDEQLFTWVMGWFASLFQRPAERIGTALVLRGPQGAGKSIVGEVIGSLLGPHYQLVSEPRYITGRFNSHLASCLLLQLDEGVWGGDHVAAGRIKDLVTGRDQLIEYKGKEPVRVRNFVRLLITSNNDWVVPAGLEERRFAVLDVGDEKLQDSSYFQAIREELAAGGREKLLQYLLAYDLSNVPLRQIPSTAALFEQKVASLSPELSWWLDVLMAGQLPGDRAGEGRAPTEELYRQYLQHAQQRGITRRVNQTALGIFLRKCAPGVLRHRPTLLLEGRPARLWCYDFPALAKCREAFDRLTREPHEWGDRDAEWGSSP